MVEIKFTDCTVQNKCAQPLNTHTTCACFQLIK